MSLLDQAILDAKMITEGPFSSVINITSTTEAVISVKALGNNIGRKLNTDTGMIVNSTNASVVVSESSIPYDFPVRNSEGLVTMLGYLIDFKDNTGTVYNYIVQENIPDRTLGLITLILGTYKA